MMKKLIDYLPDPYARSPEMTSIQTAIQPEVDLIWESRDDLLAQLDVNTATWGLDYWERALGLTAYAGKPDDYRRTRIISRIRGSGPTTVAHIKNVSESFSNGTVDVVEIFWEYRVEIRFVGTIGLPPNLDDLQAALNDIMPAHIAYDFVYYYRTHAALAALTHGSLSAYTHTQLREGDL